MARVRWIFCDNLIVKRSVYSIAADQYYVWDLEYFLLVWLENLGKALIQEAAAAAVTVVVVILSCALFSNGLYLLTAKSSTISRLCHCEY